MASPIPPTIESLCRHAMLIHLKCLRCGHQADIPARAIRTDANRNSHFRSLRYVCRCGFRRVTSYAFPADWRE